MSEVEMETTSSSNGAAAEASEDPAQMVEKQKELFVKGLRMLVDNYTKLQTVADVVLPQDLADKINGLLATDRAKRRKSRAVSGDDKSDANVEPGKWDYVRTAALVDRALENGVAGITEKTKGVSLAEGAFLKGVPNKAPHMVQGTNFMRSQAVAFDPARPIVGPFDEEEVKRPVKEACKMDWFVLPECVKLDLGSAEPHPGMAIELGDPVKCGCDREAIQAYNKRPLFMKVLEILTVDFDRLGTFLSLLVEDARIEAEKGDKAQMKPILVDLDDICSLMCNRIAALFYLACQNSREVALGASGLTGFRKNWMRLAHASKILFEPGKTNRMNLDVKSGKESIPQRRPAPGGGDGRGRGRGRGGGGRGRGSFGAGDGWGGRGAGYGAESKRPRGGGYSGDGYGDSGRAYGGGGGGRFGGAYGDY